jgi:hypothetical protein
LRQIGVSGNITSFLRLDKVFVSIKGNNAGARIFKCLSMEPQVLNFKPLPLGYLLPALAGAIANQVFSTHATHPEIQQAGECML